ncbi:hypothetical protein TNCV_3675561 [Trichonephila clavipes]|nr:hypothetical protein TNCV_3675561 [Trichonephila clavipes]
MDVCMHVRMTSLHSNTVQPITMKIGMYMYFLWRRVLCYLLRCRSPPGGATAQNEIAVVPDFHKRILFSDEAHFWLNGYVNKQNCRIWSEANPQVYVETPLHPEKLTVWCALWAGGFIGPYFFKNDEGHNVTVNGDR